MPQSAPKFESGSGPVTCHAPAALTGARFVTVSAAPTGGNPTVAAVAVAGAKVFGVVVQDAPAGSKVAVHASPGTITTVQAAAAIAVGASVQASANGRAETLAAGAAVGVALEAATAADQLILVALRMGA